MRSAQIPLDLLSKWNTFGNYNPKLWAPAVVDVNCPNCYRSLASQQFKWNIVNDQILWAVLVCQVCSTRIKLVLLDPPNQQEKIQEGVLLLMTPSTSLDPNLVSKLEPISSDFVRIYEQTQIAEQSGLNELVGIGYRKAVEFLIKDFLIQAHPDRETEIRKKFLGSCISDYVENPNLKECVTRFIWLANDEAHFDRKWTGHDLNDLKTLLQLALGWLDMELMTRAYKRSMPDKKDN